MGQSPGPFTFLGIGHKILRRTKARPKICIDFLRRAQKIETFIQQKIEAHQGSGSNFFEGPGVRLGSRSTFKARDWPRIDYLRLDSSLYESLIIIHKEREMFLVNYRNSAHQGIGNSAQNHCNSNSNFLQNLFLSLSSVQEIQ